MRDASQLPRWATLVLLPVLNLVAALLVAGVVIAIIGESPLECLQLMLDGAFGYAEGIGYTLYYSTSFIFAGLGVAVAFHAGLFNIGGEGQAMLGGLGAALVCLAFPHMSAWGVIPLAILASMIFGAGWALIPGWLQAYRGSHVVITTIMFNFVASSLMTWMLVDVLIAPGQQTPESRPFSAAAALIPLHEIAAKLGIQMASSPLNLSLIIALLCAVLMYIGVWHTRWGFALRTVGVNPHAAHYAGIPAQRVIVIAMLVSGALAGLVAINEVLGVQHRLTLSFTNGAGFIGIGVALMGRNHPVGVVLSALLFGALYQGGTDLSFAKPMITREMIMLIQGLIILFCGALDRLFLGPMAFVFMRKWKRSIERSNA
jgi:general nucleoside transport system permease protein